MNQTLHKFTGGLMISAFLLVLVPAGPAMANENFIAAIPTQNGQFSCQMYGGEISIEALKQRETRLKDEISKSADQGVDYCEMANIQYTLARLEPDRQVSYLNSCIDYSDKAILKYPRSGAAYFFKGLCLGRLGEMKGIWGSLKIIEPFRKNMEAAVKYNPALDSGGPHRALGRLYFKLPRILGGNLPKSIEHLVKAVAYGPQYWENHFFLAESYYENHQYVLARAELRQAMEISSKLKDDPEYQTRKVTFEGLMENIENHIN